MQDFAPFIPELLGALGQTPGRKGRRASSTRQTAHQFAFYFSIFSPATSKSIDIPDCGLFMLINKSKFLCYKLNLLEGNWKKNPIHLFNPNLSC
jgi:hypothetical protein